jgi:hypothetical protein
MKQTKSAKPSSQAKSGTTRPAAAQAKHAATQAPSPKGAAHGKTAGKHK